MTHNTCEMQTLNLDYPRYRFDLKDFTKKDETCVISRTAVSGNGKIAVSVNDTIYMENENMMFLDQVFVHDLENNRTIYHCIPLKSLGQPSIVGKTSKQYPSIMSVAVAYDGSKFAVLSTYGHYLAYNISVPRTGLRLPVELEGSVVYKDITNRQVELYQKFTFLTNCPAPNVHNEWCVIILGQSQLLFININTGEDYVFDFKYGSFKQQNIENSIICHDSGKYLAVTSNNDVFMLRIGSDIKKQTALIGEVLPKANRFTARGVSIAFAKHGNVLAVAYNGMHKPRPDTRMDTRLISCIQEYNFEGEPLRLIDFFPYTDEQPSKDKVKVSVVGLTCDNVTGRYVIGVRTLADNPSSMNRYYLVVCDGALTVDSTATPVQANKRVVWLPENVNSMMVGMHAGMEENQVVVTYQPNMFQLKYAFTEDATEAKDAIFCVDVSASTEADNNSPHIAVGYKNDQVAIYNYISGYNLPKISVAGTLTCIALSSSGWTLVTGTSDGLVTQWDVRDNRKIREFQTIRGVQRVVEEIPGATPFTLDQLYISPDKKYTVVFLQQTKHGKHINFLHAFDSATGTLLWALKRSEVECITMRCREDLPPLLAFGATRVLVAEDPEERYTNSAKRLQAKTAPVGVHALDTGEFVAMAYPEPGLECATSIVMAPNTKCIAACFHDGICVYQRNETNALQLLQKLKHMTPGLNGAIMNVWFENDVGLDTMYNIRALDKSGLVARWPYRLYNGKKQYRQNKELQRLIQGEQNPGITQARIAGEHLAYIRPGYKDEFVVTTLVDFT